MQMFEVRDKTESRWPSTYHRTIEEAHERIAKSSMGNRERQNIPGIEYLEIVVIERESQPCVVCGGESENSPEKYPRYPYCRHCHYTGQASEDIRGDQMKYFREQIPEATVCVDQTGGGCEMLSFYFEGRRDYIGLTDGDAALPTRYVEETGEYLEIRGGWGYMGIQYACLGDACGTGGPPESEGGWSTCCGSGEGPLFFYTHGTAEEGGEDGGEPCYSDEAVVLLIRGWLNGTVTPEPPYTAPQAA